MPKAQTPQANAAQTPVAAATAQTTPAPAVQAAAPTSDPVAPADAVTEAAIDQEAQIKLAMPVDTKSAFQAQVEDAPEPAQAPIDARTEAELDHGRQHLKHFDETGANRSPGFLSKTEIELKVGAAKVKEYAAREVQKAKHAAESVIDEIEHVLHIKKD